MKKGERKGQTGNEGKKEKGRLGKGRLGKVRGTRESRRKMFVEGCQILKISRLGL
jgi:hypothetical protein